ncbi:S8 family serine peptidase [Calidifontibacillus erzurumensis]|nr:S8 family serine peptidase [Calidifontibacillus erzurumensis]
MEKKLWRIFFLMPFIFLNGPTAIASHSIQSSIEVKPKVEKVNPININVESPQSNVKKFIIEVEKLEMIDQLRKKHPNVKIARVYDTVFKGVSVLATEDEVEKMKHQYGVKRIDPVYTYKVELDESVPFIGGTLLRGEFDEENKRLTGKGVKIGVIDTGIDYNHPDLIRNYRGGYDVIDEDEDPMETVKGQGEVTIHGTHVAGIIAANGKYLGVAPDAEIYAYRALGPGGYGTSDHVIAAIEKAVEDGMDIINLSLGSSVNGPDYPTSVALDKAVEKGVIAVTSSGNSGPNIWTVGSPGTSEKAISVGASTPPLEIPVLMIALAPKKTIYLQPLQGSVPWNISKGHQIVFGGLGRPDELRDVKNKIVLLERGEISFTQKVKNAYAKGAKAVLIFNNEKGSFFGSLEEAITIPAVALSREDGLFLKKEIEKGHDWAVIKKIKIEDRLAPFSSRGPVTHTWGIKPDVVAPGVKIDSTVPYGYTALQGTSMAAPHVAGAAALIKQAHPDWGPEEVKAALMNTAKPIFDENENFYNPYEQGAGRIQVDRAIKAEVLAIPGALAFGAVRPKSGVVEKTVELTVENKSQQVKKLSFAVPRMEKGIKWQVPLSFYLEPKEKRKLALAIEVDTKLVEEGIYFGHLQLEVLGGDSIMLPYMYIVGDADYPRVMGFSFEIDEDGCRPQASEHDRECYQPGAEMYKYELYLPEGADELGVALFDPTTLKFVGVLLHETNVNRGLIEQRKKREEIPFPNGEYLAVVYATKDGKETTQRTTIKIGPEQ